MSFQWYPDAPAQSHEDAVHIVLEGLDHRIDPRKVLWVSYPANQDRLALEEKAEKEIDRFHKEWRGAAGDYDRQWFVGIPRFRVISKGVPCLSVDIDLYQVVSDDEESFWGKLAHKADHFEFPLALLDSLPQALMKGELEAGGAHVVETGEGEKVYEFMGREWRVPDAFLGFLWALAEKKMGLDGLLDPPTLQVLEKAKAPPQAAVPGLPPPAQAGGGEGGDVQDVLAALTHLGIPKKQAEQAVAQAQFTSAATLEEKIKAALQGLNK